MRKLSEEFATALAGDATTLCRCWRLARRDGATMGFTDHDGDLSFGGVVYKAAAGLDAAQAETALGFSVGGGDVQGALIEGGLRDADLDAGLYDEASVEIWLVDWSQPARRMLLDVATIGEVRRTEFSFVAELRSLAHRFDQEQGRQFQRGCDADLGDARCGVALDTPDWSTTGAIVAVDSSGVLTVEASSVVEAGFLTRGALCRRDGAAPGPRLTIKSHETDGASHRLTLWSAPNVGFAPGDPVRLFAGCDKSPETCRLKFDNIANFRGFPHMPGNDVVMAYPKAGARMDGGSLLR